MHNQPHFKDRTHTGRKKKMAFDKCDANMVQTTFILQQNESKSNPLLHPVPSLLEVTAEWPRYQFDLRLAR